MLVQRFRANGAANEDFHFGAALETTGQGLRLLPPTPGPPHQAQKEAGKQSRLEDSLLEKFLLEDSCREGAGFFHC
jgi:hypothetical protein